MAALTKAKIAERITENVGLSKADSKTLVESFMDKISEAIIEGEEVKLSGFGNFTIREKPARPGRNPKTGEAHVIAARRVTTFRAGQKLRERTEHPTNKPL
ncbi:integration host factor subunit alpha [Vibrio chagasii]|nr:integration host factor subunit alpha [Vibrio chagasii]